MIQTLRQRSSVVFGVLAALLVLAFVMIWLESMSPVKAAAVTQCKIVLAIDRSASVGTALGDDNATQLKTFVRNLFQPGGIYDANKFLAFWSFSSAAGGTQTGSNYDSPWSHVYANTKGTTDANYSTFNGNLNQIQTLGGTSYEEGFGFKGYHNYNNPNPALEQYQNTAEGINQLSDQANVIVFITDGVPSTPGVGDNNLEAQNAGLSAVNKLRSQGKIIMGGLIQGQGGSLQTLNYVINGDRNKNNDGHKDANGNFIQDTYPIDSTYVDFTANVTKAVKAGCDEAGLNPQPDTYSLTPISTENGDDTTATYHYDVTSVSSNGAKSDTTGWNIYQMIVPPGVSANPLYFGGAPYQDDWSCQKEIDSLNTTKTVSCIPVPGAHGNNQFPLTPPTTLDGLAGPGATSFSLAGLQVGTKVCFVLEIDQPTDKFSPVNRFSKAACHTIGVHPSVNVLGGDLRVGGQFSADASQTSESAPSTIQTTTNAKTVSGKTTTYGSWAEYSAIAPGDITGFASSSGFQGGYDSSQQDVRWKLTYANTVDPKGHFTDKNSGMQPIADYAKAIRESQNPVAMGPSPLAFTSGSNKSGLYEQDSGNLTINRSTLGKNGTTHKGETAVVYVPNGRVTIADDIIYDQGPYTSIDEIPQLVIIAKSIVINGNVTNVDAWLIATGVSDTNDAVSGWVYTCDVLPPAHLSTALCNRPLTINGPIISHHLGLRRTAGSGVNGSDSSAPAETINLPGTSYLWAQNAGQSNVRAETTFTTELPPYF